MSKERNETRQLSPVLENYLEIIFYQEIHEGAARASSIAEAAGVSRSTVTSTLKTLKEMGYVDYEPYSLIHLTEAGMHIGRDVAHRHIVIQEFLQHVLQLEAAFSSNVACELEHVLPPESSGVSASLCSTCKAARKRGRTGGRTTRKSALSTSAPGAKRRKCATPRPCSPCARSSCGPTIWMKNTADVPSRRAARFRPPRPRWPSPGNRPFPRAREHRLSPPPCACRFFSACRRDLRTGGGAASRRGRPPSSPGPTLTAPHAS